MSRQINAGDTKVTREDIFYIDPNEIVVDIKGNGRWKPLDHAKVVRYALSFKKKGQKQACLGRPLHDKRVQIAAGFHRYAASMLVRNGSVEDGIEADPMFRLAVRVQAMNEKEAFECNIVENNERSETTVIDNAHNYRRLKGMGYDDAEVKELFNCRDGQLRTFEELLTLPDDIQLAVHERRVTITSALDMAKMSEPDRREVLAVAVTAHAGANGKDDIFKVDAERVQNGIDAYALTPGTVPDRKTLARSIKQKKADAGQKVSMTLSELREFLSEIEHDEDLPIGVRKVCVAILDLANGKRKAAYVKGQLKEW